MNDKCYSDINTLTQLNTIISFAESLPEQLLIAKRSNNASRLNLPESIVSFALDFTLSTEWQSEENENFAGEIESILSQLDVTPDSRADWDALFIANKALTDHLQLKRA